MKSETSAKRQKKIGSDTVPETKEGESIKQCEEKRRKFRRSISELFPGCPSVEFKHTQL